MFACDGRRAKAAALSLPCNSMALGRGRLEVAGYGPLAHAYDGLLYNKLRSCSFAVSAPLQIDAHLAGGRPPVSAMAARRHGRNVFGVVRGLAFRCLGSWVLHQFPMLQVLVRLPCGAGRRRKMDGHTGLDLSEAGPEIPACAFVSPGVSRPAPLAAARGLNFGGLAVATSLKNYAHDCQQHEL